MAPNQSVSTSIGDEVFHYAHVCACHNSFIGNGSVESKTTVSVYSNPGPVAWLQQGEVAVPRTECDIRENFDTNECPNIFVSTKLHE